MELIDLDINEQIATITLKNGKVNAISHQVIAEINDALDQAEAASAVVILTGQPGIFSGGFDLKTMKESSDSAISLQCQGVYRSRRRSLVWSC